MDFRLRRVRWLAGAAVLLVVALTVGVFNSRRCLVVVYNQASFVRSGVQLSGSGEVWRVKSIEPEQSLSRGIPADTPEGVWHIRQGGPDAEETEVWFEPGPGRRLVVHIWPDGRVEVHPQDAWWE